MSGESDSVSLMTADESHQRGDDQESIYPWETWLVGLVSFTVLVFSSHQLGVWELSESLHAKLADWMWTHETWLQVNVPLGGERVRSVSELAMGWWPSMLSVKLFESSSMISTELALRLPSLALGSLTLSALYSLMRGWKKPLSVSLIAVSILMITPAFSLITRHSVNAGGIGTISCLLSCLCYWRLSLNRRDYGWRILGAFSFVLSAGSLGLLGFLPVVAWISTQEPSKSIKQRVNKALYELGPSLLFISIFAWRSWVKRPEGADFLSLFVFIDTISQVYDYAEWSGFQRSLHLIGFGLFPIGSLLPIVAYTLRRADTLKFKRVDSFEGTPQVGSSLILHLVLAFFGAAILSPLGGYWGGGALLISVPFAIAAALYLTEWRDKALPPILYSLSVILFWLLLHGDLKRDPALLVSSLTGESTEGLLPNFNTWRYGKWLSLLGLILVVASKTAMLSEGLNQIKKWLSAQSTPRHHPILMAIAGSLAFFSILPHLTRAIPRWVVGSRFLNASFWGGTTESIKIIALALSVGLLSYHALLLLWKAWVGEERRRSFELRDLEWGFTLSWLIMTPHYLDRLPIFIFMRPLTGLMENPDHHQALYFNVCVIHCGVILLISALVSLLRLCAHQKRSVAVKSMIYEKLSGWFNRAYSPRGRELYLNSAVCVWVIAFLLFSQKSLPDSLSAALSHQSVVHGYQARALGDEPLQAYLVKDAEKSFYLSALPVLNKAGFSELATEADRQMFVIDRSQLSRANSEFRKASGHHLPVIDDSHHELLLATNQLADGEADLNPIKQAVIDELPEKIIRLEEPIDFDRKIELVGWKLSPAQPRPGAPLKIDLFWRAKRRIRTHWKVFIHIDAPGQRIHADHEPVLGVYPTEDWQEGDLIIDTHHITVKRSIKPANFTFFAGLYRGKTRMKIKNKNKSLKGKDNRAILGKVRVR